MKNINDTYEKLRSEIEEEELSLIAIIMRFEDERIYHTMALMILEKIIDIPESSIRNLLYSSDFYSSQRFEFNPFTDQV